MMTEPSLNLNRRKFMLLSSATIASPLVLHVASSISASKAVDPKITEQKATTSGKIYFINSTCVGCQVCRTFCPAKAIRYGDCQNEIDQKKCLHCGTCYRECPICAISETAL